MTRKFIRLDEDHFAYVIPNTMRSDEVDLMQRLFLGYWPGKQLIIISAEEFVARPGEYEVVKADGPEREED
jgi:hypothetical protein